jgi:hypothetical protein
MVLLELIREILVVVLFLNQMYYVVGAIKELFAYSTKRYICYWLYNCYIATALFNLIIGRFAAAFAWAAVAAVEYHVTSEFINKRKEESNLDE